MFKGFGVALERDVKCGTALGLRLGWIGGENVEQVFYRNRLECCKVDLNYETCDLAEGESWLCVSATTTTTTTYTAVWRRNDQVYVWPEKMDMEAVTAAYRMPTLNPLPHFYFKKDDALFHRQSHEYVWAMDWAYEKDGETKSKSTKRYFCATDLAGFRPRCRPYCDRSLYSIMLGGLPIRLIQMDVEAYTGLNPWLKEEGAQEEYIERLIELFREFRGNWKCLTCKGSDKKKFSWHLYFYLPEHVALRDYGTHDRIVKVFREWLDRRPGFPKVWMYNKKNAKNELVAPIDIDALGRSRLMRLPLAHKMGDRFFVPQQDPRDFEYPQPNILRAPHHRRILDEGEEVIPESAYLYTYRTLYPFLAQFRRIKNIKKEPFNLVWIMPKNSGTIQFNVPHEKYDEFLRLYSASRPGLMHEAFVKSQDDQLRRFSLDIDGCRVSADDLLKTFTNFTAKFTDEDPLACIKVAPPKRDFPDLNRFHLVAGGIHLDYQNTKAFRAQFDDHMRALFGVQQWPKSCRDLTPRNLRMLNSDKLDNNTHQFCDRVLTLYGGDTDDPFVQQKQCSIRSSATAPTPLKGFSPKKKAPTSNSTLGTLLYDPTDEYHRECCAHMNTFLSDYSDEVDVDVRITGVDQTDEQLVLYTDSRFCLILPQQIADPQHEKEAGTERKSNYEHKMRIAVFRFHRGTNRMTVHCLDHECAEYRREKGISCTFDERIIFDQVPIVSESSAAEDFLLTLEESVQHFPRIHAYRVNGPGGGPYIRIPDEMYDACPSFEDEAMLEAFKVLFQHAPDMVDFWWNKDKQQFTVQRVGDRQNCGLSDERLHKVKHLMRVHEKFPGIPYDNVLFGESRYLWDYDLSAVASQETWFTYCGKGGGKTFQTRRVVPHPFFSPVQPRVDLETGELRWEAPSSSTRAARVLITSPLISVSEFYQQQYGIWSYLSYHGDNEAMREADRLIISLESIHKLATAKTYDIVIFDESKTSLSTWSGTTIQSTRLLGWCVFQRIVREATLVICSDANAGSKTYDTFHRLRDNATEKLFYNYRSENAQQYLRYEHEAAWLRDLQHVVEVLKEPTFVVSNSKTEALLIYERFPPEIQAHCLLVTGDTYNEEDGRVKNAVKLCETEFVKYLCVIITPVVGPAVDFSVEYFSHCFAWGTTRSNTPAQWFQMIGRVRTLSSQTVRYCVPPDRSERPTSLSRTKSFILNGAKSATELGIALQSTLAWNNVEQRLEAKVYDELFLDVHAHNEMERFKGDCNFGIVFEELLILQNKRSTRVFGGPLLCTREGWNLDEETSQLKELKKARKKERKEREWLSMKNADTITATAYSELVLKSKGKRLSDEEQLQLEKYQHVQFYGVDDLDESLWRKDTTRKRARIQTLETALCSDPDQRDFNQLDGMLQLSPYNNVVDLDLTSVQCSGVLETLRLFGFPGETIAQCIHPENPHQVTEDYCERALIAEHLGLRGNDTPIKYLRKRLKTVNVTLKRKRFGNFPPAYSIDATESLTSIAARRGPLPDLPANVSSFMVSFDGLDWNRIISWILCFSPMELPYLNASFELVAVPHPTRTYRTEMPLSKILECKTGPVVFLSSEIHYFGNGQLWRITVDGLCQQLRAPTTMNDLKKLKFSGKLFSQRVPRDNFLREDQHLDARAWISVFAKRKRTK